MTIPKQENTEFYRELLDTISDGVYFVDRDRRITFWNKGAERLTGYLAEDVVGTYCANEVLEHVNDNGVGLCAGDCPLQAIIRGEVNECSAEVYLHHSNGQRLPVHIQAAAIKGDNGEVLGAVEVFSDNSAAIGSRALIEELKQLALVDPLTGIANRRFLEMKLSQASADYDRHAIPYGVLMIDVDHFKGVNDTYGHAIGDRVLQMIGETLRANVRVNDLAGRYGGEEFLVVVSHITANKLQTLAEKLRVLVAASFLMAEGNRVAVTVSIGATMVRDGEKSGDALCRADQLLYGAKEAGRNRVLIG